MEMEYIVRLTSHSPACAHRPPTPRRTAAALSCYVLPELGAVWRSCFTCCRRLPRPGQKTLSDFTQAVVGSRAPKLLITLTAVQLLILIVGSAKGMGALSENPSIGPSRERLRQMGALDIAKIVEGAQSAVFRNYALFSEVTYPPSSEGVLEIAQSCEVAQVAPRGWALAVLARSRRPRR
jgi:hypothetical protein